MPTDSPEEHGSDYWFRKMVVDKLRDLAEVQKSIQSDQKEMHEANQAKAEEVAKAVNAKVDTVVNAVNEIKLEVHSFRPVRLVVYAGIGSILLTLLAAVLALVLRSGKV